MNHWVQTQLLALTALPQLGRAGEAPAPADRQAWVAAREITRLMLTQAGGDERVWALGTLAELEVLGAVYAQGGFDAEAARAEVSARCGEIRRLTHADAFPRASTLRQFRRYAAVWRRPEWDACVQAGISALSDTRALSDTSASPGAACA